MPGSSESRYIRLEGESLHITFISSSTERIFDSLVAAFALAFMLAFTSSRASPAFSVEIRVSYELGRMLGSGEVVGELQMSWDELLDQGDEPFNISFPPVRGVHPSLTLKATVVHACDDQDGALSDSLIDCEITRDTDAGHAQIVEYVTSRNVSHLNATVEHFQLVLDQCPVSHPDHATALTNLAWARLRHPDHSLSLHNLALALEWRHNKKDTDADIREAAQICHELLPLCPEGTYLRSIAAGANNVDYVIRECNKLPKDASDEGIYFRRVVLEICPLGHQLRLDALLLLGHADRDGYLHNLALSLVSRFGHQDKPDDLDEAISLHEESLRLRPVGHESRYCSLSNLGSALNKHGDIDDITRAISLNREALTLLPPGHPSRDTALNNLAVALKTRYNELDVSEDLNEAIDLFCESLRSNDHPRRYTHLSNLSSALCACFVQTLQNEDVEEVFQLHSAVDGLFYRYVVLSDPADLSLAIENFRLASRHATQGFPARIMTAWSWVSTAEENSHTSALEAYSTFFELLDAHLATRSSATSQCEAAAAFSGARTLPVDAASCAICHDNLWHAVELAEQGRGQQWSLASRLRTPVEDLESANPKLAHNYLELIKLISDAAQSSAAITDKAAADWAATEYRRLTVQWEAAVAEIRDLRGFSRFLLPPLYEDLQAAPRNDLIVLLRAVWDVIMLPIINVLQYDLKLKLHSRIWLCPTAAFTSIPLHAAHPFRTNIDGSKEQCLEDLYICSYTPTLSALVRSRQGMKKRVTPSFVTIGQGQPRGGKGKELLAVDSELELVHKLVPEFAFLSACHTAVGDDKMPDEVIHLAAGLQFSGFKSIVGTLWEVDDAVAKHVVKAFYENMFEDLKDGGVMDCTKAAWALNCATHAMKMTVLLEQRMVFIHIAYQSPSRKYWGYHEGARHQWLLIYYQQSPDSCTKEGPEFHLLSRAVIVAQDGIVYESGVCHVLQSATGTKNILTSFLDELIKWMVWEKLSSTIFKKDVE
ncbi:hypothetical protein EV702DRAFT_1243180 [Suillus placidus]|uniref:CHAT domain-containing protein n=1 Tax=Suillus placidus TaxID=48579 RepID=A0A9P6ZQJ2_9AGAM|nr:hypothetical protein EV702DRAFT_1243180 [Suillus placidus]